jgi:hypothetical protein
MEWLTERRDIYERREQRLETAEWVDFGLGSGGGDSGYYYCDALSTRSVGTVAERYC